jgi:TetR/AcrR family transcriptional regulator, regulator of cefoperazone and chloramphenicol sensitivity
MTRGRRTGRATGRSGRARVPRHPLGGGYARGVRTRQRIIETAIEMFGNLGYQSASTRAIARRAAVSLPALQYYFGSKEGLHRACAEYMTEDIHARLDPVAAEVQQALASAALSRRALLVLLRRLLEPFLEGMAADRPESWVLFFTRAQSQQTPAFNAIFERIVSRLVSLVTQIIGRILDEPPNTPEVLIRALAILSQIASVRRGRPLLLRALGWAEFDGERLITLREVMWKQIEASLK